LVICSLAFAPAAFAQSLAFSETAVTTAFSTGGQVVDGYGQMSQTLILDGSVSGTPINGASHVQEDRFLPAGAIEGPLQGSFTLQDAAGNTISGNLSGQFNASTGGDAATGQFTISGGTGVFTGASGSGDFQEGIPTPGAAPVLTLSGGAFAANLYPSVPVYPEVIPSYTVVPSQTYVQPDVVVVPQVIPHHEHRDNDHDQDYHAGHTQQSVAPQVEKEHVIQHQERQERNEGR
jgi:hypothetical protein